MIAAVAAGKAAAGASRLLRRGGGSSLPGVVARRIDPQVLTNLTVGQGVPVIAVTGSNGKTTTSRFLAALLRAEGMTVAQNSAGANLLQGLTSLAVGTANLRGRMPDGVMVAEVDEGALRLAAPEVAPRVLVVTNVFRDQLDRFGEIYAVAGVIDKVAQTLDPQAVLVVNADDPMVADLAPERTGRRLTYGLAIDRDLDSLTSAADSIRCPRCRHDLRYRHLYLSHLGDYECVACGFSRPALDVAVTAIEVDGLATTTCTLQTPQGQLELRIPQAGVHIAYDAAAAVAGALALGVTLDHAASALTDLRPAFGRLEVIDADGREIVLSFAKNPTSFNATLHTLAGAGEPRHLLVAVSNTRVDGEDFGWLWDVDFEGVVDRIESVIVSGRRGDELATRLKYAGLELSRLTVIDELDAALTGALDRAPDGERLVVLAGYTPTIQLRELMQRRGWVGRYWQT
jgi:lipid II isoglutaminyl synthase (glutamine-hydrolysing)